MTIKKGCHFDELQGLSKAKEEKSYKSSIITAGVEDFSSHKALPGRTVHRNDK